MNNSEQPLALALGSGAARGWALIGILQALDEKNIKPDIIAGCSIGALVGAAYCTEQLADLHDWVLTLDTWSVMRLLDWGVGSGGVVAGSRLYRQLEAQFGDKKITECQTRFAAVATELHSGREFIFQDGSVLDAIRASCAIPGLLAPQYIQNKWMIDGAVVNPVPVSVCRMMGAARVIAIDLNAQQLIPNISRAQQKRAQSPEPPVGETSESQLQGIIGSGKQWFEQMKAKFPRSENQNPGMLAVAASAIDIMQNRITRSRLAADPPDILIQPDVADIGILEFNRAAEGIERGHQAVAKVAHLLDGYAK
ncbi:patatin-like phospholipase RssA [Gayadomonas joobiniege]|uniref:patatin-like phospholipase RssA n=1 Tax=Gayadomonas joobiniege TaxID=1234606 RepID=UPI00037AC787|nr:patatin-like phospholipase RssA [Gayadomonas joobiniege]